MKSKWRPRHESTHTDTWILIRNREIHTWEDRIFNKWYWSSRMDTCRRMQMDTFLSPLTQFRFRWDKDFHIKSDKLKLTEEFELIGTEEEFLNRTQLSEVLRPTVNTWNLRKLKSFCIAMDVIIWTKWQPAEWKQVFFELLYILSNWEGEQRILSMILFHAWLLYSDNT